MKWRHENEWLNMGMSYIIWLRNKITKYGATIMIFYTKDNNRSTQNIYLVE